MILKNNLYHTSGAMAATTFVSRRATYPSDYGNPITPGDMAHLKMQYVKNDLHKCTRCSEFLQLQGLEAVEFIKKVTEHMMECYSDDIYFLEQYITTYIGQEYFDIKKQQHLKKKSKFGASATRHHHSSPAETPIKTLLDTPMLTPQRTGIKCNHCDFIKDTSKEYGINEIVEHIQTGVDARGTKRYCNDSINNLIEFINRQESFDSYFHKGITTFSKEFYGEELLIEILRKGFRRHNNYTLICRHCETPVFHQRNELKNMLDAVNGHKCESPLSLHYTNIVESYKGWNSANCHVSADELMKCRLYYTGVDDNVKCTVCEKRIHTWTPTDIPALEHFRLSHECPLATTQAISWVIRQNQHAKMTERLEKATTNLALIHMD
jgi:Inhibitor of Apoptosis domain